MTKKAIVLVQGINDKQGYLKEAFSNSEIATAYQKVVDVKTEQYFDSRNKNMVTKSLNFLSFNLWDKVGDIWHYYKSDMARKEVCKEVRSEIRKLQADGYLVDVMAHSLGTVITLCAGPTKVNEPLVINKFYLLGSPLGIGFLPLRIKTNSHTERYSGNFYCKFVSYYYSREDFVSKILKQRIIDLLKNRSEFSPLIEDTGTSHSVSDYLRVI